MNNKVISKSLSRYLAVQAIYNQSFGFDIKKIEKDFISQKDFHFNIDLDFDLETKHFDKIFFKRIFNNVFEKEDYIYRLIKKNLSSDWTFSRLPKVLQAILKVAISEMISYPKTSMGIIVTEYLMLAESFSIEKENSFINAILDNIHKGLEENE
tara:strand:+ start:371 stop:832 length:462 start_codon:yes stop_codon:yes gene_type:complete